MSSTIFLEGGSTGPSARALNAECRAGFRKVLENAELSGRMPQLVACGSRGQAFRTFASGVRGAASGDFVALWVDSEDRVRDTEKPWEHLAERDGDRWARPKGGSDEQVFLMTTCMETLYLADWKALSGHFGPKRRLNGLPPVEGLEGRGRHDVQKRLEEATRECPNTYQKGKHSYEVLAVLDPNTLSQHLPSFRRTLRILQARL